MYARSWHRGPRFHGYDAIITSIKNMAMNRREIFRHTISFLFVFILLVCKPTTPCLMFLSAREVAMTYPILTIIFFEFAVEYSNMIAKK